MKKKLGFVFLGLFIFNAFLYAQSLDEAIIGASIKISSDLPANATTALINFRSDSEKLNDYVINELYGAILRNRRIVPVKPDQSQIQNIRGDLVTVENKESAQRIGRLLGAQYLVTGSIQRFGSEYRLNFTAIDTNAEIKSLYSASLNPQNDSQFALLLGISTENNSTTASVKAQKSKQQDEIKNWVSVNLDVFPGICLSFEYMLNPKISLGTNVYWGFNGSDIIYSYFNPPAYFNYLFDQYFIGIDAAFRFYPWGKTFFLGTALGFNFKNGIADENLSYYSTYYALGLGITPGIGWRINVGKKGYLQFQIAYPFSLYKYNSDDPRWHSPELDLKNSVDFNAFIYRTLSFGIGNTF